MIKINEGCMYSKMLPITNVIEGICRDKCNGARLEMEYHFNNYIKQEMEENPCLHSK